MINLIDLKKKCCRSKISAIFLSATLNGHNRLKYAWFKFPVEFWQNRPAGDPETHEILTQFNFWKFHYNSNEYVIFANFLWELKLSLTVQKHPFRRSVIIHVIIILLTTRINANRQKRSINIDVR